MQFLKCKYILIALILLSIGCRKDEIKVVTEDNTFPDTENVRFLFLISDESETSIADAQILIDSEIYLSDENGIVITNRIDIPALGMKAEIIATGYESRNGRIIQTDYRGNICER